MRSPIRFADPRQRRGFSFSGFVFPCHLVFSTMPTRARTICRRPYCITVIAEPGYCEQHKKYRSGWMQTSQQTNTERGYGWAWRQLRQRILERDHGLCQPCLQANRAQAAIEVDHVVSKARGGSNDESNLQAICCACHVLKTIKERRRANVVINR